ncbi:hypothetical protein F4861DRAFT_480844 [Xylaria intraflava]|nr:hypothetical protein F4861DRAFT_480844 [Xylaria intraflava]
MEKSNSPPVSSGNQTQKRKARNNDVRKEQNRMASRAYREKRKQKLALLDELLRSDSHTDTMSTVSDEPEYYSSTALAWELRGVGLTDGTRHSSNSPVPFYMAANPTLAQIPAGPQPLPAGPSRDTETWVNCFTNDYHQEPKTLGHHAEYSRDPNISVMETNPSHAYALRPATSMPQTPMPPTPMLHFDDELIGESLSTYPLHDGGVAGFPPTSEYDLNMINALESLSRLSDSQQQQIAAYIQKKRHPARQDVTGSALDPSYTSNSFQGPRPNSVPDMRAFGWV